MCGGKRKPVGCRATRIAVIDQNRSTLLAGVDLSFFTHSDYSAIKLRVSERILIEITFMT